MSLRHLRPLTDADLSGPAVADERIALDHESFRRAVAETATVLAARGIGRGDVVGAVLSNRTELVVTMYASWLLGAALTPVNPLLTTDEVTYQLADAGASLAVVEDASRALVTTVETLHVDDVPLVASSTELPRTGIVDANDLALLIYTSGTTGRPKGVCLDHANLSAMTDALHQHIGFGPDDRALLVLPLFHVNAIMLSVVAPLAAGGSATMVARFDAKTFWSRIEHERPTYFSAVPAIYALLAALPRDVEPDASSLRFAICGAAPMPPAVIAEFELRYGIPIIEGYGLSESTVALTVNPPHGVRKPGTVGQPLPGIELAIVDEQNRPLPPGVDGEVVARGATIMRGYLNKPEETAAALVDGWLHTGDVGHVDADGYLVLVDRKKDLIIRGGENISPSEVEAVIATDPAVLETAVVGRPDPVMGEVPIAFVVARAGLVIDEAQLLERLRTVLAKFKVPQEIRIVDQLPRNAVGKIVKAPLRELLTASPGGQG
jgi:long-chain acyl-CoA synthetase